MNEPNPRPCVGCGYCCKTVPCQYAILHLGVRLGEECPALYHDDERWRCEAAEDPLLVAAVGIGAGCCSPMNSDRQSQR